MYARLSDFSQMDLISLMNTMKKGYINKVVTTNLTYLPPVLYEKPYFVKADMSKFLALIIDSLNHDVTIGSVMNPTDKIHALLEKHKRD